MNHSENKAKLAAAGIGLCLTLLAGVFGIIGSLSTFLVVDALGVSGSDYALLVANRAIQIGFLAVAVLYIVYRGESDPFVNYRIPEPEGLAWIVAVPIALIAFGALIDPVLSVAGVEREAGGSNVDATATIGLFVVFFLVSWVVAAPAEELLFRGVIQGRLRETFGAVSGVVSAAFLFALFHVLLGLLDGVSFGGLMFWGLETFVSGIAFGVAYERTDNLVVPSVAHSVIWTIPLFI